jgi:hypothetical protein
MPNRSTKLELNTSARMTQNECYGLPFFHDNALGGLVKPTIIIMAKSQKGGSQPPKKKQAPTTDSTAYYGQKAYIASLKGATATTKPEMDKQFKIQDQANADKKRQALKGKPGYDKNGYPLKKK